MDCITSYVFFRLTKKSDLRLESIYNSACVSLSRVNFSACASFQARDIFLLLRMTDSSKKCIVISAVRSTHLLPVSPPRLSYANYFHLWTCRARGVPMLTCIAISLILVILIKNRNGQFRHIDDNWFFFTYDRLYREENIHANMHVSCIINISKIITLYKQ